MAAARVCPSTTGSPQNVKIAHVRRALISSSIFYWIGACVGRGSVVGVGVGTGGEVEGEGDGLTVSTDGPALVVSPTRVGVLFGKYIKIKMRMTAAANISGRSALPPRSEGLLALSIGSTGSIRGSRGSMIFLHSF